MDDVLAGHAEAFIQFSNGNYTTNLTIEGYSDHWTDFWGDIGHDEIERRAMEFLTYESVNQFEPKEDAMKALANLSKNNDLFVVTARPRHLLDASHRWINKHFKDIFKDIHLVPIWEPNNKITKADICKQIGATYLIDDSVSHCNLVAEGGMKAILFGDYAWNRKEYINDGVIRCKGWSEVVDCINSA